MRARLAIASSGIEVELREILLRDKAAELIEASPKATVPVLVLDGKVIDESYDIMLWALSKNDPDGWLEFHDAGLIEECDGAFKSALDKCERPPAESRWLQVTAKSRIGPPFGGLRSPQNCRRGQGAVGS